MSARLAAHRAPETRRLFFALWPDAALRADLASRLVAIPGVVPVPEAELHVTLEFLGAVVAPRLAALTELGRTLALPVAELILDRLEWWRGPALIVARATVPPPPLLELQARLRHALATDGYRVDSRPFVPHLTLARRVRVRPNLAGAAVLRWPIDELALVESLPRADGVRYRPLASWTR